jgi:hypothetical protein
MKVCIRVGTEVVFAYAEGQPSAGDVIVLPGDSFSPARQSEVEVVITTLHPTWRSDDDGALVPTFEAQEK